MSNSHTGKWNNSFKPQWNLGVPNGGTDFQSASPDLEPIKVQMLNGM